MSKEFGDFQTPPALVDDLLEYLSSFHKVWDRVLEPTCGSGNFISGLLKLPIPPREIQGIEIQEQHLINVRKIAYQVSSTRIVINGGQLFDFNLAQDLKWHQTGSLLVVGNPPWVTNSQLGLQESKNLLSKTNLKNLRGIEALTGSSNFDICEYIWIKLIKELSAQKPTIALLCKTSVARNVLQFAFDHNLPITQASIRIIDSQKWFKAAVSACLFCVKLDIDKPCYETLVYPEIKAINPDYTMGIVDGKLIANIQDYKQSSFVNGICSLTWRQGIKHDAASVMELIYDQNGCLQNKLGETVIVEPEYVYPLLKSTDLFNREKVPKKRAVIVTHKHLNEDTYQLQKKAPQLWKYLTTHRNLFDKRKSSIYRNKPPFSMFGIGEYSFAPYKVGISGLHKIPKFRAIALINDRPVMLDDTCYFIPCYSCEQAALLTSLLNSEHSLTFIHSILFSDAKRPITKKLLQCLDLKAIFNHFDQSLLLDYANIEFENLSTSPHQPAWDLYLSDFLDHQIIIPEFDQLMLTLEL